MPVSVNDSSTHLRPVTPTATWLDTAGVCLATLLLFSITITSFRSVATDVSARRVLLGAVPYRDFWTMYAPGSIYTMAAVYSLFGVQMIAGKVLGMLAAAASVCALHRVALRLMSRSAAAAVAGIFAIAFFSTPYYESFGSYPPAILLILLAVGRLAADADHPSPGRLLQVGFLLGLAALFKHDVAGYACIAVGISLLVTGRGLRAVALVAGMVLLVMAPAAAALLLAGAGSAAWIDLVRFPLGDFHFVRPESFPLIPHIWSGTIVQRLQQGTWWATLNLPSLALLAGGLGLWLERSRLDRAGIRTSIFLLAAYPLFWSAAHVQANTHKVTMAALGASLLMAGAPALSRRLRIGRPWIPALLAAWCLVLLAQPVYLAWNQHEPRVPLRLPMLAGITAPASQAEQLTSLAQAITDAAPPDVPLLLLGWRNDVLVYAATDVYWLSSRPFIGRHHELHPAITDTEPIQRQLLNAIRASGVLPVVVLEHRFSANGLDRIGASWRAAGVRVGARLLDEWVAANYTSAGRYGINELMSPISGHYSLTAATPSTIAPAPSSTTSAPREPSD